MKKQFSFWPTSLLVIFLMFPGQKNLAQVTVNSIVLPPYSPNIEDYADKARITITANAVDFSEITCNLRIRITGDNGIELTSINDVAYPYFTLQNAIPVTLTGPDLSEYFDLRNLNVSGIDPAELQSQGLPPGNYQVCATVYFDGVPISAPSPAGCSNYFGVNYLQPPMLISPANNSILENTTVQQVIFSWTPSPGAPVWTRYILKIVEITDPSQNPEDAMLSSTTPAFYEEEVIGTSLFFGPAQPLLDPGKRYAFQVIASESETNSKFENFGRSEVFVFQYGQPEDNIFSIVGMAEPAKAAFKEAASIANAWTIQNSTLHGTIQYLFPQDPGRKGPLKNIPVKLRVGYYLLTSENKIVYLERELGNYQYTQKKTISDGNITGNFDVYFSADTLPEIGTEFAFTSTHEDGDFVFMFNNPGMGLVAEKITATQTIVSLDGDSHMVGGQLIYEPEHSIETVSGDLYMYARLIVDNPYYSSPPQDIIVLKGEQKNIGLLNATVRSFNLKVNVKADKTYQDQYKTDNVEYMVVYLLRAYRPNGVPEKEGKASQPVEPTEKKFDMQVLAKEITNNEGIAILYDLVINIKNDPGDQYYLWATALESSDVNYTMDAAVPYKFIYYHDDAVYNPEYVVPSPDPVRELTAKPLPPVIQGSVYRYDNQMQPIAGARVRLYNGWTYVKQWVTFNNGKFKFNIAGSDEEDHWGLLVNKDGFKARFVVVPYSLILGKKYVREDILLEPESKVKGTVINEQGEGINVHLRMDDGAYKTFQPFCTDFITGPATIGPPSQEALNAGPALQPGANAVIYTANVSGLHNLQSTNASPIRNIRKSNTLVENMASALPKPCTKPTNFELYAVSGNHKIIIDPVDPQYLNDTIDVSIQKGENNLPPITVFTKKHRITVSVKIKNQDNTLYVGNPLPGAKVMIDNVGTATTNSAGLASFEFAGSGDSVKIRVEGPSGGDYVPQVKTVVVDESKDYKVITIQLKPAGRVKGIVYAGTTDSSAVPNARVYADIPGEIKIEAVTDQFGRYELRNVPLNYKLVLRAVKSVSNYVGDSLSVVLKAGIGNQTVIMENVNFHLTVYNDMDISKLLGFPIEVTRLTLGGTGGTEVFISGNFLNIPGNKYFNVLETETNPRFQNTPIVPSPYLTNENGIPLSQPRDSKVTTNKNNLGVKLFSNFAANLMGDHLLGLEVVDLDKGIGAINGKMKFDEMSFTTPLVSFNEPVYLSASGKPEELVLTAFTNDPLYMSYPNGLHISDNTGGSLSFSMDQLTLEANPALSTINGDSLCLNAVLHTKFKHVPNPDAQLPLGKLKFIKNSSQEVTFNNIYGKDLVIQLSQSTVPWSMHVSNWIFGKNTGLLFKDGYINTGIVTVPFTDIYVEHVQDSTGFIGGQFNLDELSLANIATLTITGQKQFGFDVGRGAWKLSVAGQPGQPCAYFGGLPGMAAGAKIEFENFFFLSNSNPIFNIYQGTKPITLYQVGTFYPGLITVINNEVGIAGMIDYHVPYLNSGNNLNYKIFYFKNQNGTIAFRNEVAKFLITPPGPVTMEFFPVLGTQTLDPDGFTAKGKVYETIGADKLFEFDAWLYRTKDSTSLIVDKTTNQMFRFSGNTPNSPRLENVSGRMFVSNGNWTPFNFNGALKNANGASGSLSFIVQGDLVANKQQISVTNLPGPLTNIGNLTYDFDNKRFTGIIDFEQTLAGGASFNASAEVLFDPHGWYFLGLGSLSLQSPSMGGEAAVFIGNYMVNQYIIDKFIPNSRVYQIFGEPPAGFPKVNDLFKGFYIEGGAHIPIPLIPQFEFDLGLISAELSHEVGADFRMGMNFDKANTYTTGISVYGRITARLGSSMVLVCASSSVTGKGLIGADGLYSSNGSWSATGYTEFGISGTTELGFGACDSDCDGIFGVGPCTVDSESAGVTLFGKFVISDSGTDFEFGFK